MPQRGAFFTSPVVASDVIANNMTSFLRTSSSSSSPSMVAGGDGVTDEPTVEEYDRPSVVLLTFLYTTITVLAVVGNSLTIAVFSCGKKSSSELSVYLINLACADFIMALFCLPFTFSHTLLKTWIYPDPLCPAVLFLQASVLNCIAFFLLMRSKPCHVMHSSCVT